MGSGGIDALLDISRRALFTQSQSIRVIGNNIANVNTEGYSRRLTQIVSTPSVDLAGGSFGSGADVANVIRRADEFLNAELLNRINDRSYAEIKEEYLARAEGPFSLDQLEGRVGYELSQFFSALEDLQANPSSIPLRSGVIQQGQVLADTLKSAYTIVADLQRESDDRLNVLVGEVNRLTGEIAGLNSQIAAAEVGLQENLTLRDERDQRLRDLSELVTVQTVENDDGILIVTLENGFGLVTGVDTNELEFVADASYEAAGAFPSGLDGVELGNIVFDYDDTASDAHVNLTDIISTGRGEIAGLLSLRGVQSASDTGPFDAVGELVTTATYIELITRDLLTTFNAAYMGYDSQTGLGDEDTVTAGFQASSGDLSGNSPTDIFSLFTSDAAATDGGTIGLPENGDLAANGIYSIGFSFAQTDPAALAFALDLDADEGETAFADGDGRGLELLLNRRAESRAFSLGAVTVTGTIEELYDTSVSVVGGLKANASNAAFVSQDREQQVEEARASVSGVSLDEEFAKLINFQRAYEGAARMISVGDELLAQILGLLG